MNPFVPAAHPARPALRRLALLLCAALLAGCAALPSAELPPPVRQALNASGLPEDALGVVAFPLDDRRRGLRLQAERPLQPASTMKLVTAIVALDRLGTNARGRTELLTDSALSGDVLAGPLYLRGGADNDLDWGVLNGLLRQLREQGVREIRGGLVVDRTLFRPARLDIDVPPFDEQPEFAYNVIPDALGLNFNLLDLRLSADAQTLGARLSPAWPGLRLDASALSLNDKACGDWEDDWKLPVVEPVLDDPAGEQRLIRLHGSFPRHCTQQAALNLVDRQWLTARAVRQIWRELGGAMAEGDREAATPAGATLRASHRGRPLAELMRGMMKSSDNTLTRLVYLRLGAAAAAAEELTLAASDRVVREGFAARGLDASGLVLENGSGLSRSERIKPAQLAGLLAAAWDGRQSFELVGTLPVAGVDGTLSRRLKNTPAEGRARLKTGTLRNVVAIAGYVPDAQNRMWVVVAMLNHEQASRGRPVLDALVEWVARQ